ncbi:MAG: hypothetical protein EZS28_042827, partial [Streblomastix strix]
MIDYAELARNALARKVTEIKNAKRRARLQAWDGNEDRGIERELVFGVKRDYYYNPDENGQQGPRLKIDSSDNEETNKINQQLHDIYSRIGVIKTLLNNPDKMNEEINRNDRSPSPPPIYNNITGKRTNTREQRKKIELNKELKQLEETATSLTVKKI